MLTAIILGLGARLADSIALPAINSTLFRPILPHAGSAAERINMLERNLCNPSQGSIRCRVPPVARGNLLQHLRDGVF